MSDSSWLGASVYYSADGYSTSGPKLMGRQAAGQGFLRAYVNAAQARNAMASAWVTAHTSAAVKSAQFAFQSAGLKSKLQVMTPMHLHGLRSSGCLYVPQPGLSDLAWQRLRVGENSYSLCGVTHTTASHAVMDTLADLPLSPLRPWDAIVCTSTPVRATVEQLIGSRMEFLRWKLGATKVELPQLPVIPLGVHTQDFHSTDQHKQAARHSLGIGPDDVVVLFVGRLSFHAKAHPHPMLQALQNTVLECKKKVHLVQAGWFANDAIESAFREAAQVLAPDVTHHFVDARLTEDRQNAWACADIFCSFSDNIQETFGLTPIEAMAAGLPVVVSDWDGYKDTVRDGVDGFRVNTYMPKAGDGLDLAASYERGLDSYDMYCGKVCEFIAVDIEHATQVFLSLVTDSHLRREMGEAGRLRAQQVFDWSVVMDQYIDLWAELAQLRSGSNSLSPQLATPIKSAPSRPDPFELFATYASDVLDGAMEVRLGGDITHESYLRVIGLGIHKYAAATLPSWPQVQRIVERLGCESHSLDDLYGDLTLAACTQLRRHLLWMIKVGWLSVIRRK